MTFDTNEKSEFSQRKIELYEFIAGATTYYYTNAPREVVWSSGFGPFEPLEGVRHSPVVHTTKVEREGVIVTVPYDFAPIQPFVQYAPAWKLRVNIYETGYPINPTSLQLHRLFWGRAVEIKFGDVWAEIVCESKLSNVRRAGLQDEFQNLCNFVLYSGEVTNGRGCPALKANHDNAATVTTISGSTLTVSGLSGGDDTYNGGFVEASNGDRRDVVDWVASTGVLHLTAPFPSTTVTTSGGTSSVTVYDGCDHTRGTTHGCRSARFTSETNAGEWFGGFDSMPNSNHFVTGNR